MYAIITRFCNKFIFHRLNVMTCFGRDPGFFMDFFKKKKYCYKKYEVNLKEIRSTISKPFYKPF